MEMLSVNDPDFRQFLDRLLKHKDIADLAKLEELIQAGLNVDEKLTNYIPPSYEICFDEISLFSATIYASPARSQKELLHLLIMYVTPVEMDIEACLKSCEYKLLESLLTKYEDEVPYKLCRKNTELFWGFGKIDLCNPILNGLFPIEYELVSSISGIDYKRIEEEILLLCKLGSPFPRLSIVRQTVEQKFREKWGVRPNHMMREDWETIEHRYKTVVKVLEEVYSKDVLHV